MSDLDALRNERDRLLGHIERLSAQITTQSNAMMNIYKDGYSAGYAARDKLCMTTYEKEEDK